MTISNPKFIVFDEENQDQTYFDMEEDAIAALKDRVEQGALEYEAVDFEAWARGLFICKVIAKVNFEGEVEIIKNDR
ncbi:MAG: hypothetical protein HGB12_14185 [Bacteroidetes bacterium]|nr:hypothetical protein [Bacteroidota bacterium]